MLIHIYDYLIYFFIYIICHIYYFRNHSSYKDIYAKQEARINDNKNNNNKFSIVNIFSYTTFYEAVYIERDIVFLNILANIQYIIDSREHQAFYKIHAGRWFSIKRLT